jgi:integrase
MSRIRRRINAALPKYVYRRSYGFIYRPYTGIEKGVRQYGKEVNLCSPESTVPQVWTAFERETQKDRDTLRWLLAQYHEGNKFRSLKPKTQNDYEGYQSIITGYLMANGKPFGGAQLSQIKRTAIQKYLDKYHAPTAANRHIQYIKAAWNWAANRHDDLPDNPCVGVELNKETARTRYVEPHEYAAIHAQTSGWVTWAMELAYICRARRMEVLALRVSDIGDDGLRLERGKKSKGEITKWTPRLRAAVAGALKHSYGDVEPVSSALLLLNNRGRKISKSAWNSALQRLRPKMKALGMENFTLHDLKAAGYSDQDNPDSGHKSPKMHDVYMRKLKIVEPAK